MVQSAVVVGTLLEVRQVIRHTWINYVVTHNYSTFVNGTRFLDPMEVLQVQFLYMVYKNKIERTFFLEKIL